jgi:endonuclease YncB( thermonuclease family)
MIRGPVTNVIDGDTFDIQVTHVGKKNKNEYNDNERIRIAGIDAPELGTEEGKKAKNSLMKKISGKEVRCNVKSRDTYSRIVADVEIL